MPCLLKKVTVQLLTLKETETHRVDLARGLPHSPHLDRKGAPCPSSRASVSPHRALLECQDFMAPTSQDHGGKCLHFQKRISFLTVTGQEGLRQPDSGPRRDPSLPYSQGHTGHLPTGTAGAPHPHTLVGPEEQHHPNLKNARIHMGKKGSSRTPRTMTWLGLLPSLKDQNRAHQWEVEAPDPSSLGAPGGLCLPSLKGPEEALLPLSSGVREDHPLAILWAQGGRILVSLTDPEASHQISCQDPGGFNLSSLKSKG